MGDVEDKDKGGVDSDNSPPKRGTRRGKTSKAKAFDKFRREKNEAEFQRDLHTMDKKMSSVMISLRVDEKLSAPAVEFVLSTIGYEMFTQKYLAYIANNHHKVFTIWPFRGDFPTAMRNILSDLLVWRLFRIRAYAHPGLTAIFGLQENGFKTMFNIGPSIPDRWAQLIFMAGTFEYGDLRQRFVPVVAHEDQLRRLDGIGFLSFMRNHAICPFPYDTPQEWPVLPTDVPSVEQILGSLNRFGVTEFTAPTEQDPGRLRFVRMSQSRVIEVLASFSNVFAGRLKTDFFTVLSAHESKQGSIAQLAYYGDLLPELLVDRVCCYRLASTHDVQIGAAIFSPLDRDGFWHIQAHLISVDTRAEDRDVILHRLASE